MTVFGETVCMSYSVICNILFDDAATSGIGLQCPALTNANWLHWLSCYVLRAKAATAFIASILFVRLSVCPSVCHTGGSVKGGAS